MKHRLGRQRLLALFAAGTLLFNFPLLALWDRDATLFGLPLFPAALFLIWAGLIVGDRPDHRTARPIDGGAAVLSAPLVVGASLAYLLLLFARGRLGRPPRGARAARSSATPGSMRCRWRSTAPPGPTTAASAAPPPSGVWFLPIYLGPTLAMVLAWMVLRKMIRIARRYRITSIADFVASRYGKSPLLAGLVTLITVVGIVPYIALQLKAIATGFDADDDRAGRGRAAAPGPWWRDSTFYVALVLAGFTMMFGTRHLDSTERHEGMVAAIAFESVVKLVAFLAVGVFVTWGLFDGLGDLFARVDGGARAQAPAHARPGPAVRLRTVVRADAAVDAVGDLPAAPVPGHRGRERRRAPPEARRLGVPALPAADQPVRAADRLRRPAALRRRRRRCRYLRAVAAAGAGRDDGWRWSPSSAACRRPPAWSSSRRSRCRRWSATTW